MCLPNDKCNWNKSTRFCLLWKLRGSLSVRWFNIKNSSCEIKGFSGQVIFILLYDDIFKLNKLTVWHIYSVFKVLHTIKKEQWFNLYFHLWFRISNVLLIRIVNYVKVPLHARSWSLKCLSHLCNNVVNANNNSSKSYLHHKMLIIYWLIYVIIVS